MSEQIREGEPQEKSPEQLVREAREEFSRPVPEEYKNKVGPSVGYPEVSYVSSIIEHNHWDEIVSSLEKYINGRDVIDCGCGDLAGSEIVAHIAKIDGARRYIGVDLQYPPLRFSEQKIIDEATRQHEAAKFEQKESCLVIPGELDGMPVVVLQGDILKILAKMEKGASPKFFVFAGVPGGTKEYFECMSVELNRLCHKGDAILEVGCGKDFEEVLKNVGFKVGRAEGWHGLLFIKK